MFSINLHTSYSPSLFLVRKPLFLFLTFLTLDSQVTYSAMVLKPYTFLQTNFHTARCLLNVLEASWNHDIVSKCFRNQGANLKILSLKLWAISLLLYFSTSLGWHRVTSLTHYFLGLFIHQSSRSIVTFVGVIFHARHWVVSPSSTLA